MHLKTACQVICASMLLSNALPTPANQGTQATQLSITQNAVDPSQRAADLLILQSQMKNVDRTSPNGTKVSLPRGPVTTVPGSLKTSVLLAEVANLGSLEDVGRDQAIVDVITGQNGQPPPPLDTLEDLFTVFSTIEHIIPQPTGRYNWFDDVVYADRRLTVFPLHIRKVTQSPTNMTVTVDVVESVCGAASIDDLIQRDALFEVDLSDTDRYSLNSTNILAPTLKYMTGAHALFCIANHNSTSGADSGNRLMPLAIKLTRSGLIYTPKDSDGDWILARLALDAVQSMHQSATHFLQAHANLQGLRVELLRHVSSEHPINQLLQLHTADLDGITFAAQTILLSSNSSLDQVTGWGAAGYAACMSDSITQGQKFALESHQQDLQNRGVENMPNYRYAEQMALYEVAFATFMDTFLLKTYPAGDAELTADTEMQAWASAVASADGAAYPGFPGTLTSIAQLKTLLVNLCRTLTVFHAAINGDNQWNSFSLSAFYKELPASKGLQVDDVRAYLTPNNEQFAKELTANSQFRRNTTTVSILNVYQATPIESFVPEAVTNMQADMERISSTINNANAARDMHFAPYSNLMPERVAWFSLI